jgi:hypothetical protein
VRTIIGDNIIGKRIDNQIDYQMELIKISTSSSSSASFNPFDLYPNNTSLLLHMNGSNESTTFVDDSLYQFQVIPYGNVQITTDNKKFGNGAAYFDGNGAYLEVLNDTAFGFGREEFTIECWVYPTELSNDLTTIMDFRGGGGANGAALFIESNTRKIYFYNGSINGVFLSNETVPLNEWTNIAAQRRGYGWEVYMNGIICGGFHSSNGDLGNSNRCLIGTANDIPGNYRNFKGYIDEVRVTNRVARYVSNSFPIQTGEFLNPDPNNSLQSWIEVYNYNPYVSISYPNQTSVDINDLHANHITIYGGRLVENLAINNMGTANNILNIDMLTPLKNLNTLSFMNTASYRMGWNELDLNKNWNKFDNIAGLMIDGFNTIYLPDTPDKVGTLPNLTYLQINTQQLNTYSQAVSSPFNIEKFLMSDVDDEFSIPENQFNTSAGGAGVLTPLDQNSLNLIFSGIDANGKEDGTIITDYVDMGNQDGNNVILDSLYAKRWIINGPSWNINPELLSGWLTVEKNGVRNGNYISLINPVVSGINLTDNIGGAAEMDVRFINGTRINSLNITNFSIPAEEDNLIKLNFNDFKSTGLSYLQVNNIATRMYEADVNFVLNSNTAFDSLTGLDFRNCARGKTLSLIPPSTGIFNNLKSLSFDAVGVDGGIALSLNGMNSLEKLFIHTESTTLYAPTELSNLKNIQIYADGEQFNPQDLFTSLVNAGTESGTFITTPQRINAITEDNENYYHPIQDLRNILRSRGWAVSGLIFVYPYDGSTPPEYP